MAKRFTPIIGLAVVVALAMVAVFGAMSLTNPAFAAIGMGVKVVLSSTGRSSPQDGIRWPRFRRWAAPPTDWSSPV